MIPPRNRHPRAEPPRNQARFVRTTATPDSNASASHRDESNVNKASPTTAPPKTAPQLITGRVEALTVARAGPIEISRAMSDPPSNDLLLRSFPGSVPTTRDRSDLCLPNACSRVMGMTEQMFELA